MNIAEYEKIYEKFLTTDEFIKEVEALGFRVSTDLGYSVLRVLSPYGDLYKEYDEEETIIATVNSFSQYDMSVYWDYIYKLVEEREDKDFLEIETAELIDKLHNLLSLYTLLYRYGMTSEEYRKGEF